jgi:hypothetical protein
MSGVTPERIAEMRECLIDRDKYLMHIDQYDYTDFVSELLEEIELLRDWIDGCQSCGLIAYDACKEPTS